MAIYLKDKYGQPLSSSMAFKKIVNRLVSVFADAGLWSVSLVGHFPSHLVRNGVYRLAGAKIGRGSTFHMNASFYSLKKLVVGKDTIIGRECFIDGRESVVIGDHVDMATGVMIYNSEHKLDDPLFEATLEKVVVGDYVFIGPRAIILPGITIHKGAVVGAGAVVTKDVPEFAIVGGVPAKVIGQRQNRDPHYILGRARLFQ